MAAQAPNVNIAQLAGVKVSASSSIPASPPSGINDGSTKGVTAKGSGNGKFEWVSAGTTKEWIQIDFPAATLVRDIVIFPRVNSLQTVTSMALNFTTGDVVTASGPISTSGSHVSLGTGLVTAGVRVTVTGVGPTTTQAGFAEIEVYNRAPPTTGLLGTLGDAAGSTLDTILGLLGLRA